MDPRTAMSYHLGNALLHLQYLAGHMPWFVPPADIAPAPASSPAGPGHHLTTFVPHPGRHSNPASSSRPTPDYTVSSWTFDDHPGVLIGPHSARAPAHSSPPSYGHAPPATSVASAAPPEPDPHASTPVARPPPRGLSISRSPPMPPPHPNSLTTSTPPPPTGDPVSHGIPTTTSVPPDPSTVPPPSTHPAHPPSPVMAPERRHKRRRVDSIRTTSRPSGDMPPPAPIASESSIPPPASAHPPDSSTVHTSGHVLPITDSPPRDPVEPGPVPDSDSDDSHLSTHPPSGDGHSAPRVFRPLLEIFIETGPLWMTMS
eukprot:s750_g4.t1